MSLGGEAVGLRIGRGEVGADVLWAVRAEPAHRASPVVVLLDASGSMAGAPLRRSVAFVRRLLEALDPARPAAVVAARGVGPHLVAPLEPAPRPRLDPAVWLARATGASNDLGGALDVAAREVARWSAGTADLSGADVVLVSDLRLEPSGTSAERDLLAEAAAAGRVVRVRVPTHLDPPVDAAADVVLEEGAEEVALERVVAALGGEPLTGRIHVAPARRPRRWLHWAPGRLRVGPPASLDELELPLDDGTLAFLADGDDEGPAGRATLEVAGRKPVAAALDPTGAEPLDPALVAAVERALGGSP